MGHMNVQISYDGPLSNFKPHLLHTKIPRLPQPTPTRWHSNGPSNPSKRHTTSERSLLRLDITNSTFYGDIQKILTDPKHQNTLMPLNSRYKF